MILPFEVRAPGKLLLSGEYAVLDGGTAIVAAIDRYFIAHISPLDELRLELSAPQLQAEWRTHWAGGRVAGLAHVIPPLRFLATGADLAARDGVMRGRKPTGLSLMTTSQLLSQGEKLGLGGSAAATVTSALAVQFLSGLPLDRARLLRIGIAAHRLAQGKQGSGADVAASVYGGLLAYTAPSEQLLVASLHSAEPAVLDGPWPGLSATSIAAPPGLCLGFAAAGPPVETAARLERYRAWVAGDAAGHTRFLEEMGAATTALRDGLEKSDAVHALAAVDAAGEALVRVEQGAGFPVWTEAFRAASDIAREHGCAAKPSGAGGGDCAVLVGFDLGAIEAALVKCGKKGMHAERVGLGVGAEVDQQ